MYKYLPYFCAYLGYIPYQGDPTDFESSSTNSSLETDWYCHGIDAIG